MKARFSLSAIAALLLLMVLSAEDAAGWNFVSIPLEVSGTTAPSDTTARWFNTDWSGPGYWSTAAQAWIDGGDWIEYGRASADYGGPLKFGHNIDSDTISTGDAYNGFVFADSIFISEWAFHSDASGTLVDATVQLFECPALTDIVAQTWTTSANEFGTNKAKFGAAGTYACYLLTGTEAPDMPWVRFRVHRFKRLP